MKQKDSTQFFEMKGVNLFYYQDRSILMCRSKTDQKLWAKKIYDINFVSNVLEDADKFYLACESGEKSGQFIAIFKKNGRTAWFIPGRTFLEILYEKILYLIFIDESDRYYLLSVNLSNGKSKWHHNVKEDLKEYTINKKRIKLNYASGKYEIISASSGKLEDKGSP